MDSRIFNNVSLACFVVTGMAGHGQMLDKNAKILKCQKWRQVLIERGLECTNLVQDT